MGALQHTDPPQADLDPDSPSPAPLPKKTRPWRRVVWLIALMALIALGFAAHREAQTSRWQARIFSEWAAKLTYRLAPGASDALVYPGAGPFD
ncbi:hypothetical protein CAZ07_37000, partial [Pseudomonas aeruginosa]|uniref:hypothetical protein n=1 Tax=Pseudomonas aeruginosa TaxID=287 RepID=UPI000B6460B8